ncbi:MAG: GNAT family N-acetyltransferase, partial [Bryobacteraceae bacterium]
YNPPYYHSYLKNCGFATEKGVVEMRVEFSGELAERYRSLSSPAGVRLRAWDFSRIEAENSLFTKLLNETFAQHWGAGPFAPEEAAGLTAGMRDWLVPEFCWFAEVDGEHAGFVYALPDLNQGAEITHGVLLIIGVRSKFRGRGVNLALGARSYLAMIERGYRSASYTVVLDDNWASRRTAEKLGCRVARNFVVYRRDSGHA